MSLSRYFRLLAAGLALCLGAFSTNALAITDTQVFTFAEANYPSIFTGARTAGQYQQYNYRYYPASGNYLAVDTAGVIFVLGPVSGNVITSVGTVAAIAATVTAWETTQTGAIPTGTNPYVYVATYTQNSSGNFISVIDTATNTTTADKITLAFNPSTYSQQARGMAVNPAGTRLYVADYWNSKVAVIDTAAKAVIATITVGNAPRSVAISPTGSRVYVANGSGDTVSVIDAATNTVITNVPVTSPHDLVINPAGTRLYVSSGLVLGSVISVIDTASNTVISTIQRQSLIDLNFPVFMGSGYGGLALNPAGTRLYVASNMGFFEIDTSTSAVTAIPTGSFPFGVAVNSSGTRVYVTNYSSGTVSVIDATTRSVIATILAGAKPTNITLNAAETWAYVANASLTSSILVIDTATNATSTIAIQGYPSSLAR